MKKLFAVLLVLVMVAGAVGAVALAEEKLTFGYIAYQNKSAFSSGTAAYNYVWDIIHYVYGADKK